MIEGIMLAFLSEVFFSGHLCEKAPYKIKKNNHQDYSYCAKSLNQL